MRRSALCALAVAVLAVAAGGAKADVRLTCKTRALDVYFWPHGRPHPNALMLPAYRAPNLEVYNSDSVATKSYLVFVSASSYNYATNCKLATNPLATRWGGGAQKTITTPSRVRCTFPWIAQVKVSPANLRVLRGASTAELLRARIGAKASSLTFDPRYCRASRM